MLTVIRLKEYTAEIVASIAELNSGYTCVTRDELTKFMKDHNTEKNQLLLTILPEHNIVGSEDNVMWENALGMYVFEKTDYSEHDHDSYLNIFANTQATAKKLVDKLFDDKANHTGALCNFLQRLEESSIIVSPVKGVNGCNGYYIGITFDTP